MVATGSYGTWTSPITAEAISAATRTLSEPRIDSDTLYWLEDLPAEGGRTAIVMLRPDGSAITLTPAEFNVRSEVHSYGGGAYEVSDGVVYFANIKDHEVYSQSGSNAPVKITTESYSYFADFCLDRRRKRLIAVREDRTPGRDVLNSLVAIDLTNGRVTTLHDGADFYSSATLSPDETKLAWLSWRFPHMPWTSTQLSVATLDANGALTDARVIVGDQTTESIFQPQWSPDSTLYFVSDRSDFWNLYRWTETGVQNILPREAEFGVAQWNFGMSTYAFASADTLIYAFTTQGSWRLGRLDLRSKTAGDFAMELAAVAHVRAKGKMIAVSYATPAFPTAIATIDINTGEPTPVRTSLPAQTLKDYEGYLSTPRPIEFATGNKDTAYGFVYPPTNKDWQGPAEEKPPLIVMSHGGPTSAANSGLKLNTQFWTSRGFYVLDVNYRGSTGYGRKYREKLNGQWGIFDVEDCIEGAKYLANESIIDGSKMAITGGSAGGYTTLCALTFREFFAVGASYYGVSDLVALTNTHKFESRYLDWLIEPYQPGSVLYHDRSPINYVHQLATPVIFFQGALDPAVPPDQATKMFLALAERKISTAAYIFQGEKHGFRQPRHKRIALEAELQFYLTNLLGK